MWQGQASIKGYMFSMLVLAFMEAHSSTIIPLKIDGTDTAKFNLNDRLQRNTIDVPVGGWAVIRVVADNPGVWLFHCHIDTHLTWSLGMAFEVENGVGELQQSHLQQIFPGEKTPNITILS
ncbi:hypothetical protein POM88_008540 [Heracleum sosnowskyi]|uniref:Plastocyanin-like domain-containing protein n=1 Tax=Heracleum sosnowskyi TaxID=360622 RepID=A0AAD8J6L1_9APIA|nr:hypothetical protein POM88_008540 [Heracleum sosnowskyi]